MMTQHDAAVPGIDNPDPEPLAVEDGEEIELEIDYILKLPIVSKVAYRLYIQLAASKCDFAKLFSSNARLWHMARMDMKVGEPIGRKHGFRMSIATRNSMKCGNMRKQLEKLDPQDVLITNPAPNSWQYSINKRCLEKFNGKRIEGYVL